MALKKAITNLLILYAEHWVWFNTMMLLLEHPNNMWLMIMRSDLPLVLLNARYWLNVFKYFHDAFIMLTLKLSF